MGRVYFNIVLLLVFAWGAYGVLEHADRMFTPAHWAYYYYAVSPWALLFGSLKAWHRSFVWRRMSYQRTTPPILSRGEHRTQTAPQRTSILEHASIAMLLLAIAAILEQLGVSLIAWWIGSLMGAWIVLRFILNKAARS
ncbi:MAG: hypothetical protein JAZ11_00285 [Candidatus Thiodiazotropha lotti]|nr:hypothetical protein [Candidatus Thiodiazotropha lotti]